MTLEDLARMRENYTLAGLDEADLAPDWVSQFEKWMSEAVAAGIVEPNAMVLATASPSGMPSARTVLAKAVDSGGVVFYTNYTSAKSHDLEENPWAAVTFPWYGLQRQIHVRGRVHPVDREDSLAYWRTRPRASQLGAWASPQSTVVNGRHELEGSEAHIADQFGDGEVPLPPHWGGWRIEPVTVEFWQGRTGRMHDRLRYRRLDEQSDDAQWVVERLAP